MFNKSKNSFLYLSGTNAFFNGGSSGKKASKCRSCWNSGPPELSFRSLVLKYPIGLEESILPHLQDESPLEDPGYWSWDEEGNPIWIPNRKWGSGGSGGGGRHHDADKEHYDDPEKDRWYKGYFGKLKWPSTGKGPFKTPPWDPNFDPDEPTDFSHFLTRLRRIFFSVPIFANIEWHEYGGLILEGWGNYDLTDPVQGGLNDVTINIGQKISKPFKIKGTYHTHTNDKCFSLEDILELWKYAYLILISDPDRQRFSKKQIHVLITPNFTYYIEIDSIWDFFIGLYDELGLSDILPEGEYGSENWDVSNPDLVKEILSRLQQYFNNVDFTTNNCPDELITFLTDVMRCKFHKSHNYFN